MAITTTTQGIAAGVCLSTARPTNPYLGQIIYETDTNLLRAWSGSAWSTGVNLVNSISNGVATGTPAVSATYSDGGFNWKRIDFTASSNLVVSSAGIFDVLVLAGGGGGGGSTGVGEGGGGGGAGILFTTTIYIPAGTYAVTVGGGGAGGADLAGFGGWSGIGTLKLQSAGGAGGGNAWGGGIAGPNSGGASYRGGYGSKPTTPSQQLYGFVSGGADGSGNNGGGAGMGGAGATRAAGIGLASTFTGTSITYAAGGLGGGTSGTAGGAGTANRGNGGGGAIGVSAGAAGGSGFVSVRWKV